MHRQQQRLLSLVESLGSHLRSIRSRAASCCSTRCALAVFVLQKVKIIFINHNRLPPQISSLPAPSTLADPSIIASRVSTGIQPPHSSSRTSLSCCAFVSHSIKFFPCLFPTHDFSPSSTGDAVASLFASARDEAISHAQQRNALFAEATAA
jgi:hypothetical protein